MKIPDAPLLVALGPHLGSHHCWHVARHEAQDELRKQFPGECGRELRHLGQAESGCDFLHFHRRMIRHFKWLIAHTSGVTYKYGPWTGSQLPGQIEDLLRADGFDLGAAYKHIANLTITGTASDLGGFIEANTMGGKLKGSGIHNRIHKVIHKWESTTSSDHSADMKSMRTAPANEFFWKLHGWIDEIYATWQRGHGEPVDQSPAHMHEPHIHCDPMAPSFPSSA